MLSFKSTVTKFLVKIPYFELLVMTEKKFRLPTFFLIKYFKSQSIFYVKIATTSLQRSPLFPTNPPLKVKVLSSPPFLKIW